MYCTTTLFRDTYNLIPVALDKLVESFGLKIETKLFFPHNYNRRENYDRVSPGLPPKSDYYVSAMMPKQLAKFTKWYDGHSNEEFDLAEKLGEYCVSDTRKPPSPSFLIVSL